jgi:hypothetical protein
MAKSHFCAQKKEAQKYQNSFQNLNIASRSYVCCGTQSFTTPIFLEICASGAGAACDFHKKVASYRINVINEHMKAQQEDNTDESEDDKNHDYCESSAQGTNDEHNPLIMCDGCPISYHFTCLRTLAGYESIRTLEELPKTWYCGHSQCRGSEPASFSSQSHKRQREHQFKPSDSEVQQIVLYVSVDSPFSYGKAKEQREMWKNAVGRCHQHRVAKGATAKQLAIWMAKICESHFHANPLCFVSPSSVLDHLTREWLLPRVLERCQPRQRCKPHWQQVPELPIVMFKGHQSNYTMSSREQVSLNKDRWGV